MGRVQAQIPQGDAGRVPPRDRGTDRQGGTAESRGGGMTEETSMRPRPPIGLGGAAGSGYVCCAENLLPREKAILAGLEPVAKHSPSHVCQGPRASRSSVAEGG